MNGASAPASTPQIPRFSKSGRDRGRLTRLAEATRGRITAAHISKALRGETGLSLAKAMLLAEVLEIGIEELVRIPKVAKRIAQENRI